MWVEWEDGKPAKHKVTETKESFNVGEAVSST